MAVYCVSCELLAWRKPEAPVTAHVAPSYGPSVRVRVRGRGRGRGRGRVRGRVRVRVRG